MVIFYMPGKYLQTFLCIAGEVFGFWADGFTEPFFDCGAVDVVVINPVFVAGVIGRVDVDAFDFSGVVGQEGFEGEEVVAFDEEVLGVCLAGGEGVVAAEQVVRDLAVVVEDGLLTYPVEGRHYIVSRWGFIQKATMGVNIGKMGGKARIKPPA
jgi:hypothetical protein